jgi:hypothetical protein
MARVSLREMPEPTTSKPVERLFPFVIRAKKLLAGRETLARSKSKLQWVLISTDISESSRDEVLSRFGAYPVIQRYSSSELERFFGLKNAKVLGFAKSTLAKSIYSELKQFRLNPPKPGEGHKGQNKEKADGRIS